MASDRVYFNERANEWDTICVHDQEKVAKIVEALGIRPNDCVLDVGTGTGVLIPHLLRHLSETGHVVAVDVSEKMLEVAKGKCDVPMVTYCHGDVLEIDWQKTFDVIVCYSMFPHFKDQKMEAIKKLSALLNDGGRFCIAHSQSRLAINRLHLKAGEAVKNDRLPEMSVLKDAFIAQGLTIQSLVDDEAYFVIVGSR